MTERGKKRVLIVGAGRRVKNNFLPALSCLADIFKIAGIHARTAASLDKVCNQWGVQPIYRLDDVDFSSIDVVAISVPTEQNANVLRQLLPHAASITIVIDTPVASSGTELRAARILLPRFSKVIVTEDYMNFPSFALARRAVEDGLIGRMRAITLTNVGFRYHGLALIRSFVGFERVSRTRMLKVSGRVRIVKYLFSKGVVGCVIGPYRRSEGTILIEGTSASITDSFVEMAKRPGTSYRLERVRDDEGAISGFRIVDAFTGGPTSYSVALPQIKRMTSFDIADKSELNLLRGCGLASVFRSLVENDPLNDEYGPNNAVYDNFVSHMATKGLLPIDPFKWLNLDIMAGVTSAYSLVSRLFGKRF